MEIVLSRRLLVHSINHYTSLLFDGRKKSSETSSWKIEVELLKTRTKLKNLMSGGLKVYSILEDFVDELMQGSKIAILPISRFIIESKFNTGKFFFYPAGSLNIQELRIVRNDNVDDVIGDYAELDLREVQTSATGADEDVYKSNTLVAFPTDINWDSFLSGTHESDLKLIRKLSQEAEKAMDLIRYYFCRYDLSDTLPGPVGTWSEPNGFSTALLYNVDDNESYIIAGSVLSHIVIKGIGLELDDSQVSSLDDELKDFIESKSEVASIAKLGLSLNSGVLESNTPTTKFVRSMTLLEYLAFPYDMKKFELVRKQISLHIARDKKHYHELGVRFNELTGKKDEITKEHVGYRTRIVHLGHALEDILSEDTQIMKLFLELQSYAGRVISEMVEKYNLTWDEFLAYREDLKIKLGIKELDHDSHESK